MTRKTIYKIRRASALTVIIVGILGFLFTSKSNWVYSFNQGSSSDTTIPDNIEKSDKLASDTLETLEVKGRAPKTNYSREKFYKTWPNIDGCNLRQRILKREFGDTAITDEKCNVISGTFYEPYTGQIITFETRKEISDGLQIDHVVALSDAWQKGAQYMSDDTRYNIATDPLNLIAVDAKTNQKKSDGDAATWLPPNKSFRCQYIARQISVKSKYSLWVTEAEKTSMKTVLETCPEQTVYGI
ncbi:MAG: HNH endonuclease family protein [Candidatus Saccharibacteria bacterium]|nr:HNH endonuclease family protein [Candidatus Saccharibacteria bacterium]